MKVAVYAIALNEARFVQRWADSARGADCVIAVDTGSTDGTLAEFGGAGVPVISISIHPWRFDDARNAALALVPADVDVCIALDMDEVLMPGWRDALERAWRPGTTRLRHPFAFTQNEDGTPKQVMYSHRIHARHAYRWAFPIHEALTFKGDGQELVIWCDDLWIHHLTAPKPTRATYLPTLAAAAKDNPACERMAFYYARELMYHQQFAAAEKEFLRYLDLPTARWPEQRCEAMRYIGRCQDAQGRSHEHWYMRAVLEHDGSRLAWTELANNRMKQQDWMGAVWAAGRAMRCAMPKGELYDVKEMAAGPYDIGGVSAFYAGLMDKASTWMEHAAQLYPDDERYRNNMKFIPAT